MYVYLSNNGWRRDVRERLVVGAGEGDSCGQRAQDGEISHVHVQQWSERPRLHYRLLTLCPPALGRAT